MPDSDKSNYNKTVTLGWKKHFNFVSLLSNCRLCIIPLPNGSHISRTNSEW